VVTLTPAITLDPGDSLEVDFLSDIVDAAAYVSWRVSIASVVDIEVVDTNDGQPAPMTSSASFPWATSDILVNDAADSLVVNPGLPQTVFANTGQSDVPLMALTLSNAGSPNTATAVVNDFTLTFFDSSAAPISPTTVLTDIRFQRLGQPILASTSIGGANELIVTLLAPLNVAPGAPEQLSASVSLPTVPGTNGFYTEIVSATAITARDVNTAQVIGVFALDPVANDFPLRSNTIIMEAPASGVSVSMMSRLPATILPAANSVPVMDLTFAHPDSTGASLEIDSLVVLFSTPGGTPLPPGDFFAGLTVTHEGSVVSSQTSLSSVQPLVECLLPVPVLLAPGGSETLSVFVDANSIFQPASFNAWLDVEHVVVLDSNDGSRVMTLNGNFPLVAGPSLLQLPSGLVQAGLISRLPQNVSAQQSDVIALDLLLQNSNPAGFTAAELKSARFRIESADGVPLDPSQLLSSARLIGRGVVVSQAVFGTGEIAFTVPDSAVVIHAATVDTLSLVIDMDSQQSNVDFRLVVDGARPLLLIDAANGDSLTVGTIGPEGFPIESGLAHVLGNDMAASFTNYPNPFAAGREATRITYFLQRPSTVTLKLYTVWGKPVCTLVDHEPMPAGLHQDARWTGANDDGDLVNHGVYFLVINIEGNDGSRESLRRKVGVVR
jgi:hypothetical protein